MPYTPKAHRFFALCSTAKGRKKARAKCPSLSAARRMMSHGVKRKGKP